MLEFVHNLLDLLLPIHFDLKVVTSVDEIRGDDEEPLIDFIERDRNFKLLMWSHSILLILAYWYGHLPDIVRLVRELDNIIGHSSLLGAPGAPLLLLRLAVGASGGVSTRISVL